MKRIRIAWTHKKIKDSYDGHGGWHYDTPENRNNMEYLIKKYNSIKGNVLHHYIEEEKEENNG